MNHDQIQFEKLKRILKPYLIRSIEVKTFREVIIPFGTKCDICLNSKDRGFILQYIDSSDQFCCKDCYKKTK